MKIETYKIPESSFLSYDKDVALIVDKIFENDRLKKLLYYTTPDCLSKPKLTAEQTAELFGREIKLVPKIEVDPNIQNYLFIDFDNFTPNNTNPEFRDNIIYFDILCHFNQWHLQDFQLRPFKIAGEIDSMFNKKHLTGIGKLLFLGANKLVVNEEYSGYTLMYLAIHGDEDKKWPLTPFEEE